MFSAVYATRMRSSHSRCLALHPGGQEAILLDLSIFFLFHHPHNVTITKDDFKMARKPKETTRLMQHGLSHLYIQQTP